MSRCPDQTIVVSGDVTLPLGEAHGIDALAGGDIVIRVVSVRGDVVRLGIVAAGRLVLRGELDGRFAGVRADDEHKGA